MITEVELSCYPRFYKSFADHQLPLLEKHFPKNKKSTIYLDFFWCEVLVMLVGFNLFSIRNNFKCSRTHIGHTLTLALQKYLLGENFSYKHF